jgi:membrane fusion protein, multidrug efflux system
MTDQERFDQEVAKKGKVVLEVLAGVGIFAAVIMSAVALVRSGEPSTASTPQRAHAATSSMPSGSMSGGSMMQASNAAQGAPAGSAKVVDLKVIPQAKPGPDGKKHDAFTVTEFHVNAGQPVTLRINNEDDMPHSITSQEAGVNIIVQPGTHDYTLKVDKAGKFEWNCALPCDTGAGGWAMEGKHGYMAGYITVS